MRICLYGASSNDIPPLYMTLTEKLGEEIARKGHSLIYGGGANGLMGAAARGVVRKNGSVIGVAPSFFNVDGVLFEECTEFIYTQTMRERKQLMEDHSDAFVVTPGGIGTFEEFFEILTLKQLGRHNKPIIIYNLLGYFNCMNAMMENAIKGNFMKDTCRELYTFVDTPEAVIEYLQKYTVPSAETKYYKNI